MRYALCVVVVFHVLLMAKPSTPAQEQSCKDFNLQAVAGSLGYQHRSAPERCEGLYQSPVAGESLEFLSFVSGSIDYDLKTDKVLVIAVPDVSRLGVAVVRVQVRALPLGTFYRMDTTVNTAKAIEWPLNTVIAPAGLYSNSIGVLGWIEKEGRRIYVPISVLLQGKPLTLPRPVTALLRSPVDIEEVRWRLWATDTMDKLPPWQVLRGNAPNPIRAGEPIRLPIAASSQLMNLEVAVKMANSVKWLKILLRVFLP
jgi:hypothetical protein